MKITTFVTKSVKMKNVYLLIQKYPLSCLLTIGIWVICMIPLPETPLDDVKMIDKWTHFVMFGGLSLVIWIEYIRQHRKTRMRHSLPFAFLFSVLMGGLIELAQAQFTTTRNGDWLDFLADGIGVIIGNVIGMVLVWYHARA